MKLPFGFFGPAFGFLSFFFDLVPSGFSFALGLFLPAAIFGEFVATKRGSESVTTAFVSV